MSRLRFDFCVGFLLCPVRGGFVVLFSWLALSVDLLTLVACDGFVCSYVWNFSFDLVYALALGPTRGRRRAPSLGDQHWSRTIWPAAPITGANYKPQITDAAAWSVSPRGL